MAKLYIVATPIGNLSDITLRALTILQEVDYIACEDSRHTQKLLNHYKISKPLLSCHAHNERQSAAGLIKLLSQDKNVAYCSDAGTPALSDPGARLVDSVIKAGFEVEPLPGASAFSCLVSVSGFMGETLFAGFLPPKGAKRLTKLAEYLALPFNVVLYESPHRIIKLLEELNRLCPQRQLVVGREMTKLYAEFWRGTAAEIFNASGQKKIMGELAIMIAKND
ncbi:MAG: 16S rRNA (cytidine(1402)-2'-O)-methyltransferase [Spirochaetaceae bacterium]|nr:16S rRNA (cytidine(1402)-2'-O)-methyltransferase [Spirochaetaceae bacterium]